MNNKYILDGKTPVLCDLMTWAEWFETASRDVAKTKIGDVMISTVFLGLNHNWGDGPPLLFETMIFGGKLDQEQERYSTWDEAEEGHKRMVERVSEIEKRFRMPNWDEIAVGWGNVFLPILTKIINWVNETLKAIMKALGVEKSGNF